MFSASEIAEVTGGRLIGADVQVNGVSTDTRTIEPGMLFVAVRGESFDGNDFIGRAAEKGAAAAISDRESGAEGQAIPVILVEDSRAAQLALARHYRDRFPMKLVGVTGSVGKTSTKDMVYAVLSAAFQTLKTEGNFNNDIGLPRTLFRLNDSYGAAVIEMGMSDLGEISVLSKAAAPDICIITNIGWCHIENLRTRENILKAKLEILDGASADAPLIINGDDEFLSRVSIPGRRIVRYGTSDGCDIRAEDIRQTDGSQEFTLIWNGKRYPARLPAAGAHHVMNAMAAFAAGIECGMAAEDIIPAFMRYEASGMRQKIEQIGDITVILDCYNASPTSMESSLAVLGGMKCTGRRIAVLGDMLELGEMSAKLHADISRFVMQNADCAFLYGKEMSHCRSVLAQAGFEVHYSQDKAALSNELQGYLRAGDVALFKGSRGMKMEEIAGRLK